MVTNITYLNSNCFFTLPYKPDSKIFFMGKTEDFGGRMISRIRKKLQKVNGKSNGNSDQWREKAIIELSIAGILLGLLLLIPVIIWDVRFGYNWVAVFNLSVYTTFLILAFSGKVALQTKGYLYTLLIYLVGLVITLTMGNRGGGIVWLFAFPIAAGLLATVPAVWYANGINMATLILLWTGIHFNWFHGKFMAGYDVNTWVITCLNLFIVSGIISITLAILLYELSRSVNKQKGIEIRLLQEKTRLQLLKEKAENEDHLKSSFLANVTHEFRTPMNAIHGFSEILLKHELPKEKEVHYTQIIHEKSRELLHLFNDILDISHIESNTLKIHREIVNIHDVFRNLYDVFDLIRSQSAKNAVVLEFRDPGIASDMFIETDPYRLKQVMSNLLTNAMKFTQSGKIEFGYYQEHPESMIFYVRDTGIGIPPDKQEIIFERYMQAGDYYPMRQPGFGLGLSICRSLVERMNGKIWVESEPGKGSTFCFSLPAAGTGLKG